MEICGKLDTPYVMGVIYAFRLELFCNNAVRSQMNITIETTVKPMPFSMQVWHIFLPFFYSHALFIDSDKMNRFIIGVIVLRL